MTNLIGHSYLVTIIAWHENNHILPGGRGGGGAWKGIVAVRLL